MRSHELLRAKPEFAHELLESSSPFGLAGDVLQDGGIEKHGKLSAYRTGVELEQPAVLGKSRRQTPELKSRENSSRVF